MEPYSGHFHEMGFDGLIKCVFSGYEARMCADVDVPVKEIRFHPYLFPVGLGGAPTFSPGGRPGEDALNYWMSVRRALLRKKIDRSGLGGYLSLTEGYPCFLDAMDRILAEFDAISALHDHGAPYVFKPVIGVLHAWGALRTWTLSGHFHETDGHMLIHVLEALSGLPFDVKFLSFEDLADGVPQGIDIIINAGEAGSAWSGGVYWQSPTLIETLTAWVHNGGVFMGIGEPSARPGYNTYLRMAHVLGVDIDNGEKACHGRWTFDVKDADGLLPGDYTPPARKGVHLTDGCARVLAATPGEGPMPAITINNFGKGVGVYMADFTLSADTTRALQNLLLFAATGAKMADGVTDNPLVECNVFPQGIVFINNSPLPQKAGCMWKGVSHNVELAAYGMEVKTLA